MKLFFFILLFPNIIFAFSSIDEFVEGMENEQLGIMRVVNINGERINAIKTGYSNSCSIIAVNHGASNFNENRRVCHGEASSYNTVTPLPPDDLNYHAVLKNTMHRSWAKQSSTRVQYDIFQITALIIGGADKNGCSLIRSLTTYKGAVVDFTQEQICN